MEILPKDLGSCAHDQQAACSSKRRDIEHEQEFGEVKKNRIALDENSNAGMEENPQTQLEGALTSQIPSNFPNTIFRIYIYYNGSAHFNKSPCWTMHHVSGGMKLCDLFLLHHLKGGPQPHGTVVFQQIDRCMMMGIAGTDLYWFGTQNILRVMDTNWIFKDNEAWLRCSTH